MCPLGAREVAGLGFELVVGSAPMSILVIDAAGRVIYSNGQTLALTAAVGHDVASDLDHASDIFRPDGRRYDRHEWPAVRSITNGEEVLDEEFFYPLPGARRLWIRCSSSPVRDWNGVVVAAVVTQTDITERKDEEERLRYHASLLDNVEDGVIATEAEDFRITAWNHGAERVYGFTAEEVLGHPARDVASYPGDQARVMLERELRETGRTRTEFSARRKDGSAVQVELITVAVTDQRRRTIGYLGIHRDISERKRAAEALLEAHRQHETILESIGDAFVALDPGWRFVYINARGLRRAAELKGKPLKREELLGKNLWEEFSHLVGTEAEQHLRRAVREQTSVDFQLHLPTSDRWHEITAYPTKDGGLVNYGRDITDRKRYEDQLRYHASLVENMHDAVLATDPEFVITAWNGGAERMFGWTAAEAVGQRVVELIPASLSDEEMAAAIADLSRTGRWRGAGAWYGKNHEPCVAEALTVAVHSNDGSLTGYVCIMRDFTELSRLTDKLHRSARQQSVLSQLTLQGLARDDVQALLRDAVRLGAEVLEVELGAIAELHNDGQLAWRAEIGYGEEVISSAPPSAAGRAALAGYTIQVGEPVISEDATADERFGIAAASAEQAPTGAVAVPILGSNHPYGVLVLASRQRRRFEPDEVEFAQTVANVVAVAVERAAAPQRLQEAREAERTRIGRELHDEGLREVTEALGLVTLARSTASAPKDEQRWGAVAVMLERLGRHLHSAIYDLRLGTHEERAFSELLDEMVAIQDGLAGEACRVELHGCERLPPGSLGRDGTEVLRIVREAITNARRHAGARTIQVDAGSTTAQCLRLEVNDDGEWPDRQATVAARRGSGILGMVERAEVLRAAFEIGGRPDGGTRVAVALPLGQKQPLLGPPRG